MKVAVTRRMAEALAERHGGRMYVVSQADWRRIRRTLRMFPKAYAACKRLDVEMTPLVARHGEDVLRKPRSKG